MKSVYKGKWITLSNLWNLWQRSWLSGSRSKSTCLASVEALSSNLSSAKQPKKQNPKSMAKDRRLQEQQRSLNNLRVSYTCHQDWRLIIKCGLKLLRIFWVWNWLKQKEFVGSYNWKSVSREIIKVDLLSHFYHSWFLFTSPNFSLFRLDSSRHLVQCKAWRVHCCYGFRLK
jgi:hypothetical protein